MMQILEDEKLNQSYENRNHKWEANLKLKLKLLDNTSLNNLNLGIRDNIEE